MDLGNFDVLANEMDEFELMAAGKYRAVVVSSEEKSTKSGTGVGINFQFEIVDGKYKGRKLFKWFNWINASEKAQAIGRSELAKLCNACGILNPSKTEDLNDRFVILTIKVKKSEEYGDQNEIVGFSSQESTFKPEAKQEEDVSF